MPLPQESLFIVLEDFFIQFIFADTLVKDWLVVSFWVQRLFLLFIRIFFDFIFEFTRHPSDDYSSIDSDIHAFD